MTSSDEPGTQRRWDLDNDTEVRAEARDVLADALLWQLAEARWQAIEQILIAMEATLARGDMDGLAEATADLELAGPLRITPIGPAIGPPPVTRDLLIKLVHSLGGVPAGQQRSEPEDAGAGSADASRH